MDNLLQNDFTSSEVKTSILEGMRLDMMFESKLKRKKKIYFLTTLKMNKCERVYLS
jgi:hypothetical protein